MLKARKKNRVIRISDEKAEEYKALGYKVTDMDGNVVCEPEDKDATIATLQQENLRLKAKIAELEMLLSKVPAPDEKKKAKETKEKSE